MRVCHIITKPELGGAQLSTLNILSYLSSENHEISLVTSGKGPLLDDFKRLKDVKIVTLDCLKRAINPILDIYAFIRIYHIYRCYKYDIVHTHSSKAGIIGRLAAGLAKIPSVYHTVHGWSFNDFQNPVRKKLFILLERLAAVFTTKIICVSESDIKKGLRCNIAPREKFKLVKYGIPLEKFKTISADINVKKKEIAIVTDGPVVGMIACLKPQKAPLDYIRAAEIVFKKIPDVNFLLIGDGVMREQCVSFLKKTGLNGNFILTGWRRDIPELLDILDVLVLSSKWEGMPISLIEALCKGKPVVATDTGGTAELIKDGVNGYTVKPGAYAEIADRLIKIIGDRKLFRNLSKNASASVSDFYSARRMCKDIATLYGSLQ